MGGRMGGEGGLTSSSTHCRYGRQNGHDIGAESHLYGSYCAGMAQK